MHNQSTREELRFTPHLIYYNLSEFVALNCTKYFHHHEV